MSLYDEKVFSTLLQKRIFNPPSHSFIYHFPEGLFLPNYCCICIGPNTYADEAGEEKLVIECFQILAQSSPHSNGRYKIRWFFSPSQHVVFWVESGGRLKDSIFNINSFLAMKRLTFVILGGEIGVARLSAIPDYHIPIESSQGVPIFRRMDCVIEDRRIAHPPRRTFSPFPKYVNSHLNQLIHFIKNSPSPENVLETVLHFLESKIK